MVAAAAAAHAQQGYQTFTQDTTKGAETVYFTSGVNCAYAGYASFEYTLDGFAANDSVTVIMQGTNDAGTKWFNIDTTIYESATAANYLLYENPAYYLKYRLKAAGKAGDTVLVKNVLFIYKR